MKNTVLLHKYKSLSDINDFKHFLDIMFNSRLHTSKLNRVVVTLQIS